MRKFWTVFCHTYLSKLRAKSFIIITILTAFLIVGLVNLQNIINMFDNQEADKVAVIDETGQFYQPLAAQIEKSADDLKVVRYDKDEAAAEKAVADDEFAGYLLLNAGSEGLPEATYKSEKVSGGNIPKQLQQALQQVKVGVATQQLNISPDALAKISQPVTFEQVALDQGTKSAKELSQARTLVYALLFVLLMSVTFYGSLIATDVATEKSSRVMEIMISSVSPVKQMFGKILGLALLCLTQFSVWIVVGYFALKSAGNDSGAGAGFFSGLSLASIPVSTIVYALVFFILGYLIFSTLLAMLGSLVSRVEDTQQMMAPVYILIFIGFYSAIFGLGAPESMFITVMSFIPFFSPMIMFLRVGLVAVPFWQVAVSIGLLVLTIAILLVIGARVYRGGVLMYGKASFKSIKQAFSLR
ncbi:ABC transporter permease [Tuberibacillus sp. Marseille-P3662]|uniref:ABC transporter permease n=1 Tax=Tuberibacillus sp. Marseille-P3662 TaxID=1965358 RepID=UPI000A1C7F66|nr:ABC transporter permease [Tuberibacillus sp. Marseille-P3662]